MEKFCLKNKTAEKDKKDIDLPEKPDKLAARSKHERNKQTKLTHETESDPWQTACSLPWNHSGSRPESCAGTAQKGKEEADAQRALRLLTSAQTEIESSVSELRAIRKREERQRKVILALNTAMETFMKDGDVEKFEKARSDARSLR